MPMVQDSSFILTGRATKYQMVRNKKKDALAGVPIFTSVKLELPPIDTKVLCGCLSELMTTQRELMTTQRELTKAIIEDGKKTRSAIEEFVKNDAKRTNAEARESGAKRQKRAEK
jgi:ERCC4-type nuclease